MLFTCCCVNIGQRDLCGSIRHGAGSETPEGYLQDSCGQEDRVCCQLHHLLSTGWNSRTVAVGGTGTSHFSLRHCGLGEAGIHIQYLAEEGQEQHRQCYGSGLGEVGPALCRALPLHLWDLLRAHSAVLGNMPHESLCRGWKNVTTYGAEFEEGIKNKCHNLSIFLPLLLFTCATDAWYGPPCSLGRYLEVVTGALALQKPFTDSVCSCFGWGVNSVLTWEKHSICFPSQASWIYLTSP